MDDTELQAIRSGNLGTYVALIEDRAKAVAGRFPKPDGTDWSEDDVAELVASFFASPAYEHSIVTAHDDDSLGALVYTGLANLVRAELRRTDRGRLQRRLLELLREEDFVEGPAKFWRRPADPEDASGAALEELVAGAWSVEVRLVKWREDAKRNSPFAESTSLVALLNAILEAAGGAVHTDILVEVVGRRLGVGPTSAVEELDLVEERFVADPEPGPEDVLVAQERELDAAVRAAEVFGQLSSRERELLPHLDDSARKAAEALGGKKSAVNEAMNRLKEKMRTILSDIDEHDRALVLFELLALQGDVVDS